VTRLALYITAVTLAIFFEALADAIAPTSNTRN